VKIVRAEGGPFERGVAIGRGFAEEIDSSVAFYRNQFRRWGFEGPRLDALAGSFVEAANLRLPRELAILRGVAEGARVPFVGLFVPNAYEELEPLARPRARAVDRAERCSAVSVTGPRLTLLGHNENWLAADEGTVGVVIEIPAEPGGVALASPTAACFLPAVGMNAAGFAQSVMSLSAPDDGVGVPRVFVSRHALEATDPGDAVRRTGVEGRSGGYAYTCAFTGGRALTIETSASGQAILDGPGPHTNHYLDPRLAGSGGEPSAGSIGRHERLLHVLEEHPPETPEDLMAILSDHAAAPEAVCLHPDPAVGDEATTVLFSMVCDLEAGRMWVADGNPCTAAYEEIDLSDIR
jgi:isopenicillin-N N-acyltransferase-like protein